MYFKKKRGSRTNPGTLQSVEFRKVSKNQKRTPSELPVRLEGESRMAQEAMWTWHSRKVQLCQILQSILVTWRLRMDQGIYHVKVIANLVQSVVQWTDEWKNVTFSPSIFDEDSRVHRPYLCFSKRVCEMIAELMEWNDFSLSVWPTPGPTLFPLELWSVGNCTKLPVLKAGYLELPGVILLFSSSEAYKIPSPSGQRSHQHPKNKSVVPKSQENICKLTQMDVVHLVRLLGYSHSWDN